MKHVITTSEAKQLKKQGYAVVAGQIVDVAEMPEWIRKRAEFNRKPVNPELMAAREEAEAFNAECARPWKGSELKSLARALGRDRDPEIREALNL